MATVEKSREKSEAIKQLLNELVSKYTFVDVGNGVEKILYCSRTRLACAIKDLEHEGYYTGVILLDSVNTPNRKIEVPIIGPKGCKPIDVFKNRINIKVIGDSVNTCDRILDRKTYYAYREVLANKRKETANRLKEDGLSNKEIADMMELSESSVRVLLS